MHFLMIGLGLVVTLGLRRYRLVFPRWQQRWQAALVQFLCPPLLLLMTAIAVITTLAVCFLPNSDPEAV